MLWLYRRVVFGEIEHKKIKSLKDLNLQERTVFTLLAIVVIFLGIYPMPVLDALKEPTEFIVSQIKYNLSYDLF